MVLNHMLTVDGSTRISDAHGVLTVKDGEDKKADKSETPVNPTDGNHSSDDKTSKPSDNNQPSADKEYKAATSTYPDSPIHRPLI